MRIWHLLTHTAGLTYGFHRVHPVDAMYRAAGFEWSTPRGMDLAQACDAWAGLPLLFQPGTEWNYSVATDVLGRVVEVASGQRLDEFFATRIFDPLGHERHRLLRHATRRCPGWPRCTRPAASGTAARLDKLGAAARQPPACSPGATAWSRPRRTITGSPSMLLARADSPAGELDGTRLLSPRTVGYMGRNHLPGGLDLETFGRPLYAESPFRGVGFGLGFAVVLDPVPGKVPGSAGELSWGGAASTAFWIDPAEELTVSFFTQLLPSSAYPIRSQLRQLVYQALTANTGS